jgi:hypothetical protein
MVYNLEAVCFDPRWLQNVCRKEPQKNERQKSWVCILSICGLYTFYLRFVYFLFAVCMLPIHGVGNRSADTYSELYGSKHSPNLIFSPFLCESKFYFWHVIFRIGQTLELFSIRVYRTQLLPWQPGVSRRGGYNKLDDVDDDDEGNDSNNNK